MKPAVVIPVLAALVLLGTPAQADDKGNHALTEQLEQLERLLTGLLQRIERLEQRLAAIQHPADPGEAPASEGAEPAPAGPAPEAAAGSAGIDEIYDRFTGYRELQVSATAVPARHMDDDRDKIELELSWTATRQESSPPQFTLTIASTSSIRRWEKGAVVYFLIDGERGKVAADTNLGEDGAKYIEFIQIGFDAAQARKLSAARSVEMRAGEWQFHVPLAFRRRVAKATDKIEEAR